jgi:RNA polymerase sigma-70 factor (ECF subfamily)
MSPSERSDSEVVAAVLTGDRESYRHLVERHTRAVHRLAWRITGNEADAQDVVQESFLRAFRHLSAFDQRASFLTWLLRIASNYSLDLVRARKRTVDPGENFPEVADAAPAPDRLALGGQLQSRLAQGIESLSEQERAAFVLRHFEGHSIDEISRTLNMGESAAKHSIFRAVKKLRRFLEPAFGGAA